MRDSKPIPIFEIAKCNLRDRNNSKYWIPNIQRGLVWKAIQMELLWDSILRGFPIGSMLILEHSEDKGEILDGQQRSNAIIAGFNIDNLLNNEQKPNTIIWLDLSFRTSESDNERRQFGIRVTNSSHPWGYDANGGTLSAQYRREAIKLAYNNQPNKKSDWDIRKFIPYYFHRQKGNNFMPIPLAILLDASEKKSQNDAIDFWSEVQKSANKFAEFAPYWKEKYLGPICCFIDDQRSNDSTLENSFLGLKNYKVVFNYVDNNDDIELLFNRVNRRGTPTTAMELTYAAIKHYGERICDEPEIGNLIKEFANGLMMEPILAQIIIRYCFSSDKIHGEVNATQIRKLAFSEEDDPIKKKIKGFIERNCLEQTLTRTRVILQTTKDSKKTLPNYLIAEIATKTPELLILLFKIIERWGNDIDVYENKLFVQALIFYLYCFSTCQEPIRRIYEIVNGEQITSVNIKEFIRNELRDSISRERCYKLPLSFESFAGLDSKNFNDSWKIEQFENEKGYDAFRVLFEYETYQGCFMLKVASYEYYAKTFGDYNPALVEYWEDINRPWDHDHIIPKAWTPESNWSNVISYWINSMGNIADIPFEENRSKSDNPNWDYYNNEDIEDLLFFNKRFFNINQKSLSHENEIIEFMNLLKKRFIVISNSFLEIFDILNLNKILSPKQNERKTFLERYAQEFHNHLLYCRNKHGREVLLSDDNDIDMWCSPCISLIKNGKEKFRHAISISIANNDSYPFVIARGNKNMDLIPEPTWEMGTCYQTSAALYDKNDPKEVSLVADLIVRGASKFNNDDFYGFTDSNHLMSCELMIQGIALKSYIYEYYGCKHCYIEPVNPNHIVPPIIQEKIRSILESHRIGSNLNCNNKFVDFYLSGQDYNVIKVCSDYAVVMIEISKLINE